MVNSLAEEVKIKVEPYFDLIDLNYIDWSDRDQTRIIYNFFNQSRFYVDYISSESKVMPSLKHLFSMANHHARSYRHDYRIETWLTRRMRFLKTNKPYPVDSHDLVTEYITYLWEMFNRFPENFFTTEVDLSSYLLRLSNFFGIGFVEEYCCYSPDYYARDKKISEYHFGTRYKGRLLGRVDLYCPEKNLLVELKVARRLLNNRDCENQRLRYERIFNKTCLLLYAEDTHKFTELFFKNVSASVLRRLF